MPHMPAEPAPRPRPDHGRSHARNGHTVPLYRSRLFRASDPENVGLTASDTFGSSPPMLTRLALIGYAVAPFVGLAALWILPRPLPHPPPAPASAGSAVSPAAGSWGP